MSVILLVDNGSVRANATRQLREVSKTLSNKINQHVYPVSFKHANRIPASEIDNQPAQVFYDFMHDQLSTGERDFILLPLFFGNSKALTSYVPEQVRLLEDKFGHFNLTVKDVIFPLPGGEPLLTDIIFDHIINTAEQNQLPLDNVVLVDHGSPIPRVTAVRKKLAESVQQKLGNKILLNQAVMERREGKQYDFNGDLLEDWLSKLAASGEKSAIVALLFFLPGRHAGEGGDIVEICESVMDKFPGFKVSISPLISEHPQLLSILQSRLQQPASYKPLPCRGCTTNCGYYGICDAKLWRMKQSQV